MSSFPSFPTFGGRFGGAGGYALTPEDEESLVSQAANLGLSGLGRVGNLLDVPGSFARDVLTWLPGGRRANPFDQLLPWNWMSGEGRTSGRDLLSDYGLVNPNKETGIAGWWDDPMEGLRDIAGFGAELITDPTLPLSLGARAVGKGGRALQAAGLGPEIQRVAAKAKGVPLSGIGPRQAGITTKVRDVLEAVSPEARAKAYSYATTQGYDLAKHLDEPTRALGRYKLPFIDEMLFGTGGPKSQGVARFLDKYSLNIFGGEFGTDIPLLGSERAIGSAVKSLLHAPTMGRLTKEVRPHAERLFRSLDEAENDVRTLQNEWALRAQNAPNYDPRMTRRAAEGVEGAVDPTGLGEEFRELLSTMPEQERLLGFKSRKWGDTKIDYAPRHAAAGSTTAAKSAVPQASISPMSMPHQAEEMRRQQLFNEIPGGGEEVNDIATDAALHRLAEAGRASGQKAPTLQLIEGELRARHNNIYPHMPVVSNKGAYEFLNPATGKYFELSADKVDAGTWLHHPNGLWWVGEGSGTIGPGTWKAKTTNRYKELASWVYDNPHLESEGLYMRDPIVEVGERMATFEKRKKIAPEAFAFAGTHAKAGIGDTADTMSLPTFLKGVGMDEELGMEAFARIRGLTVPTSKSELIKQYNAGAIPQQQFADLMDENKAFYKHLKSLSIPKALADDYLRPIKSYSAEGTPFEPLIKGWDKFTNLFKAGVLNWPSTKVRDFTSGQIESMLTRMWKGADFNAAQIIMRGGVIPGAAENPALKEILKRRGMPPTDQAATDFLRASYAAQAGGSIKQTAGDVVAGVAPAYGQGLDEILEQIPGNKRKGFGAGVQDIFDTLLGRGEYAMPSRKAPIMKGAIVNAADRDNFGKVLNVKGDEATVRFVSPDGAVATVDLPLSQLRSASTTATTWNPLTPGIRGNVPGRQTSAFAPFAAMEKVGNVTDIMNRLVPFINQVRKGVDPAEAMRRVAETQISYDPKTFTSLERGLKRILPFYSYTSRKTADIGKRLLSEPGGRTAQAIRAIQAGRPSDTLLPEHIADTTAIPLPARDKETQRFLTGLGLMFEQPLGFVGWPRAAMLEGLSSLHPIPKGLLEWATGQVFHQKGPGGGRSLEDLDPTYGRLLSNIQERITGIKQEKPAPTPAWLEALLSNLPTSRVGTTLRQLTDPRKNFLDQLLLTGTGVKISDVSPAAQDAQLRDAIQRMQKEIGGKSFTKVFVPEDVKAAMSSSERLAAERLGALSNLLARRAKERAKEKKAAQR